MANRPRKLLGVVALVLLAVYILFIGRLALSQFTPKCGGDVCPTMIEMILRAIATFFAGLMVLAGVGWWIVFNFFTPKREDDDTEIR